MSAVETLREASDQMRKRAERATDGPWGFSSKWTTPATMLTRITKSGGTIAEARGQGNELYDLDYLSYWHPAVGLAIADWLESVAGAQVSPDEDVLHAGRTIAHIDEDAALAVARAYLRIGEGE